MWTTASQWTGDYAAAGVTGVSFWANVASGSNIDMRVAISGAGGVFATNPVTFDAAAGWTKYTFDLTAAGMTHVGGGTNDFAATLSSVNKLEILGGPGSLVFKSANGGFAHAGTSVNVIWIDNVAAIPEPFTSSMLIGGLAFILGVGRSRR